MKFKVSRTSQRNNKKPCDEAFKSNYPHWEVRTCSEEKFNTKHTPHESLWKSKGKNHKVLENGHITRKLNNIIDWTIEIKSLKQLNEFSKQYGELVFNAGTEFESASIEIYDDYRE